MNKIKIGFIVTVLNLLPFPDASAQSLLLYKDDGQHLSPSEIRYEQFHYNSENRMLRTLFANPVMEHIIESDSMYFAPSQRSYVGANYSGASLPDDFHLFEGNAFSNYSINASGVLSPRGVGTVYGNIEYGRGSDEGIGWNATRHYDTFSPFLTTDSLGGTSQWEMYSLRGGYSFSINRFNLGAEFSYKGEQAYRLTDPRLLNTTSWLNLYFGSSYRFANSLLMISVGYERTKQYQTERFWVPGMQDRFFQTYGFGLYNDMYSRVSFGYSRMSYVQGFDSRISYIYQVDENKRFTASLGIYRNELKTEETSIINLYRSITSEFAPSLEYQVSNNNYSLLINAEGKIRGRVGYENIYDQVLIDQANNIYDYRLISTRQHYNAQNIEALLQIKPSLSIKKTNKASLIAGAQFYQREEEYKNKTYHILNQLIEPHIGVGYNFEKRESNFEISLLYSRKISTNNIYDVGLASTDEIQYLDFQHAFSPYAFYANQYDALRLNACYIQNFKNISAGMRVELIIKAGDRLGDVAYDGRIGFPSDAPTVSATPDAFNERWGKATLFVMF